LPIFFVSLSIGTIYASVYAVYNSIFGLLKSVIYSFINGPRMGLGQLIAERDRSYVRNIFMKYQFIVINVLFVLLSTAVILIIPFIKIYTRGVTDINYVNWRIALLLVGITFFEVIHIPSGNILNMAGNFRISRNIQLVSAIVLIISMIIGSTNFGFYGVLMAVLITAILLAVLEICYVHIFYFRNSLGFFLRILFPGFIYTGIITWIGITLLPDIKGYLEFILTGGILLGVISCLIVLFNLTVNRKMSLDVFKLIKNSTISKYSDNIKVNTTLKRKQN
ncbi:MAG: hypothetical protein GX957_16225, partial [Clostridiaceae bacterium]|nr:hypothetical protein [Clostridiaceae bacterium]